MNDEPITPATADDVELADAADMYEHLMADSDHPLYPTEEDSKWVQSQNTCPQCGGRECHKCLGVYQYHFRCKCDFYWSIAGDTICPICEQATVYVNVSRSHWSYCKHDRVRWSFGYNLFSSWQFENEAQWEANAEMLSQFRDISDDHELWRRFSESFDAIPTDRR